MSWDYACYDGYWKNIYHKMTPKIGRINVRYILSKYSWSSLNWSFLRRFNCFFHFFDTFVNVNSRLSVVVLITLDHSCQPSEMVWGFMTQHLVFRCWVILCSDILELKLKIYIYIIFMSGCIHVYSQMCKKKLYTFYFIQF